MKINLFKCIRRKFIQKLLRPEDGYTFTGFSEGDPLKFYYQEDTGKYLLGMRAGNMYYFEPTLSAWSSVSSRYLPWGETVEKCVFNPVTKEMDPYTYHQEPKEIDFKKWLFGIQDNIHELYKSTLLSTTTEELIEIQKFWKEFDKENEYDI